MTTDTLSNVKKNHRQSKCTVIPWYFLQQPAKNLQFINFTVLYSNIFRSR